MLKMAITFRLFFVLVFSFLLQEGSAQSLKAVDVLTNISNEWNKGNLDGVMTSYWQNDSLAFVTSGKIIYSYDSLRTYYKGYGFDENKQGSLSFEIIRDENINSKNHLVIARYTLLMNGKKHQGNFTLMVRKIKGRWVIVLDHS
jgi:hypothetical protein